MENSLNDQSWEDGTLKKSKDVISLLEQRAKSLLPMKKFNLSNTNLENINLVNHGSVQGYRFINSDFYKTNLKGAHCFKVDFQGHL